MTEHTKLTTAQMDANMALSPIAQLVKIGRSKSYVTFKDFLTIFPTPEKDLDLVDRAIATLITMGIPIRDKDA